MVAPAWTKRLFDFPTGRFFFLPLAGPCAAYEVSAVETPGRLAHHRRLCGSVGLFASRLQGLFKRWQNRPEHAIKPEVVGMTPVNRAGIAVFCAE